jgi:hypothetical protein
VESIILQTSQEVCKTTARSWPRWFRDPLFHFLVIGALLFALDKVLLVSRDDPRLIEMGAAVDEEAIRVFESTRGRAPNADELRALRQVWLDNEVLYREGLALGLDKGDDTIRERVIFKALNMVDSGTRLPQWSDQTLQDYFAQHREQYDQPARYDFQEAVLVGAPSEDQVRAFVQALNSGTPPDSQAGLRVFEARPYPTIVQGYGEDAARELQSLTPGHWQAVNTRDGWRAMRVQRMTPSQPADFKQMYNVILQDWTDDVMAAQRSAAVKQMADKYIIREPR